MLHIANTFLEWELEKNPPAQTPLAQAFNRNPIILQLQFLPLLYANTEDILLVSHLPELSDRRGQMRLETSLDEMITGPLDTWGASRILKHWALRQQAAYSIPDWHIIQKVNSKAFSWDLSPKLPFAALLHNKQQAHQWLSTIQGPYVLKTCFGVSGGGHLIETSPTTATPFFLEKEWKHNRPVIAEPWVERILDFSTQWMIEKNSLISFIGSTLCNNTLRGQYRSTSVGDEAILFGSYLPFLEEHKVIVSPLLQQIAQEGYVGHIGIDAMVYLHPDHHCPTLHPVVEINARKTMGWIALAFQKKHYPNQHIQLSYGPAQEGLLPQAIQLPNGKQLRFSRNLQCKTIQNLDV